MVPITKVPASKGCSLGVAKPLLSTSRVSSVRSWRPGDLTFILYKWKLMGKPWENHRKMVVSWDFMGYYPLVMTNIANWKITIFNGQIHYFNGDFP